MEAKTKIFSFCQNYHHFNVGPCSNKNLFAVIKTVIFVFLFGGISINESSILPPHLPEFTASGLFLRNSMAANTSHERLFPSNLLVIFVFRTARHAYRRVASLGHLNLVTKLRFQMLRIQNVFSASFCPWNDKYGALKNLKL